MLLSGFLPWRYNLSSSNSSPIVVGSGKASSLFYWYVSIKHLANPGALKTRLPSCPQKSLRVLGTRPVGQSLLTCTYLDFWQRHAFLCLCPFFSQWSEEDELADAKQNSEWMDECQDGMFEAWYEKIAQEDPEKQRKVRSLNEGNLK